MRYASDLVQEKEQDLRATAAVAAAICRDSRYTADPLDAFRQRGHGRYVPTPFQKDATFLSVADPGIALQPLNTAFLGAVDRESVLGAIPGLLRLPLTGAARLQVGHVVASRVGEGAVKPVGRLDFDLAGGPTKVEAQIVISVEALRAIDLATQTGVMQALTSATADATDVALVTALTAAAPVAAATPADLFGAIGHLRYPVLIGGYDGLFGLPVGSLRDLQSLAVTIVPTPAASGVLIGLDGSGLLVGEDSVAIEVARHADITMDSGGSPSGEAVLSLWQRNLAAVRAERFIRLAVRATAVAWASV